MEIVHPRKILSLMERDGPDCHYCGRVLCLDGPLYPTKDHIVPRYRGGSNRPSNLVLACVDCNGRKGSEDWHYDCQRCNAARASEPRHRALRRNPAFDLPIERCHHLSAAAYCLNCARP